jgi:hypothetical protein
MCIGHCILSYLIVHNSTPLSIQNLPNSATKTTGSDSEVRQEGLSIPSYSTKCKGLFHTCLTWYLHCSSIIIVRSCFLPGSQRLIYFLTFPQLPLPLAAPFYNLLSSLPTSPPHKKRENAGTVFPTQLVSHKMPAFYYTPTVPLVVCSRVWSRAMSFLT